MQVECENCKHSFVLGKDVNPESRLAKKGFINVGFACPECNTWFHSYWTTEDLEAKRATVNRFADRICEAKTIPEKTVAEKNYRRKQTEFKRLHDKVQKQAKKAMKN